VATVRKAGQELAMARPVVGGWVSSRYGRRLDPFTGEPAVHRGLDFAGLDNSAILAVAPGVVTWSGRRPGYGNLIEIDHGRGWVTRYGHNAFNLVTPGDYVKPGQTIALMGATGRATGTHLHFEVLYKGRHQNPGRFVPRET
jgi:murein DD-endopeptidase MepM/ murein hydrolase activator NlpD